MEMQEQRTQERAKQIIRAAFDRLEEEGYENPDDEAFGERLQTLVDEIGTEMQAKWDAEDAANAS